MKNMLPTKNNLMKIKGQMNLSIQGQELLEKKKIILNVEKNKYINKYSELKNKLITQLQEGHQLLQSANVDVGLDEMVNIANTIEPENSIDIKYKTVMGVEIPSIIYDEKKIGSLNYSLNGTTISVDMAVLKFAEIKKTIIELSEVENTINKLNKAIEKVQKRSNALKDIIIPEYKVQVKKIQDILEEREREDLSRMKVLKRNNG